LPIKVAFLGPAGTFTEAAAFRPFGHSIVTVPLSAIAEIFREVESEEAHFGVVPVENSTEGVIAHTLDMFHRSGLSVCGEVDLRIHHHLLSNDEPEAIQRVYAHPQALAQCREWLDANLAKAERIAVSSNAEGARRAAGESGAAAIGSEAAAAIYGLQSIRANIEDQSDNTTRFLVIGRQSCGPTGQDRTSLLVVGRNRPGMLHSLLEPFQRHGISMTRIESRPSRQGLWDYMFFIDIEGHAEDTEVAAALEEMEKESMVLKVLGSYPRAEL
jgi:chorismate mutase/prephenate dehydratase